MGIETPIVVATWCSRYLGSVSLNPTYKLCLQLVIYLKDN